MNIVIGMNLNDICVLDIQFFVQLTFYELFAMPLRISWTFQVFLEEFLEDARHIEAFR